MCGADNPMETIFLSQWKDLVTLLMSWRFPKGLFEFSFYTYFSMLLVHAHVHSPRALEAFYLHQHKPFITTVSSIKLLSNIFLWRNVYIFPYESIENQSGPFHKMAKGNSMSSFEQTVLGPRPQRCIPSLKVIAIWFSRWKFLNVFYNIWTWGNLGPVT